MSRLKFTLLFVLILAARVQGQTTSALRDLNLHCPFTPPTSLEAWAQRSAELELQLQVALGLYPAVELDAVAPQIYGRVDREEYTVEKVTFESLPGFYVTGNLYRPKNLPSDAKVPGVLAPHGHWTEARFYDAKPAEVKELLATGAERFESAARNHIQARCVQLARMGCVVFHWDMIGYCDSLQISFDRAHKFAEQPTASEVSEDGWLLFSPLAESHCQSILGLQSLAVRRAVDMLLTLPEVDPQRLGISGASGGGTQTFLGAALDKRLALAFPAVMVSTGMQGGCTCENACLLRTGTGNVEIAGLIAPRPLGMTAANDWTKTMPEDGFPELQQLYSLFGAKQNVALFPAIHFPHNYNHVSRVAMYGWVNDHFGLGQEKPILERDFQLVLRDDLSVWDQEHPQPPGGEDFERKLMKLWADLVDSRLRGLLQGDAVQVRQLGSILNNGWRVALGLTTGKLASPVAVTHDTFTSFESSGLPGWMVMHQAPEASAAPADTSGSAAESTVSHDAILEEWTPRPTDLHIEITENAKTLRLFLVLAGQESEGDRSQQVQMQAIVENPRLAAAYTYGYNLPLFAQRAQQLGLTVQAVRERHPNASIAVVGSGGDAALAAAGVWIAANLVGADNGKLEQVTCRIQPAGFAFSKAASIRDPNFLPGSARFWDLPGLIASAACVANTEVEVGADDDAARLQQLVPLVKELGGTLVLTKM